MITPTDIKTRYPEFSSIDDSRIQLFIDDAVLELDDSRWGNWYDKGLSALTAHFLSISLQSEAGGGTGGSVGDVASRSVGDVSISFSKASPTDSTEAYYNSTPYGQEYLRLMRLVGMGAVAVC